MPDVEGAQGLTSTDEKQIGKAIDLVSSEPAAEWRKGL